MASANVAHVAFNSARDTRPSNEEAVSDKISRQLSSIKNAHHIRKIRSNGSVSQEYFANSQPQPQPQPSMPKTEQLDDSQDHFAPTSSPETHQPTATAAPSIPEPVTSQEHGGTSFLSSVFSSAANVLRGSSRPADHKRSFSDNSFFGLTNRLDVDGSDPEQNLGDSDTEFQEGSASPLKEVKIEPVRPPAIDTIGKGELSLESLGLVPVRSSPALVTTSSPPGATAAAGSSIATTSHSRHSFPAPLNSDFYRAASPSRPISSYIPQNNSSKPPTTNESHFTNDLVIQQPERAYTPQFPTSPNLDGNPPTLKLTDSPNPPDSADMSNTRPLQLQVQAAPARTLSPAFGSNAPVQHYDTLPNSYPSNTASGFLAAASSASHAVGAPIVHSSERHISHGLDILHQGIRRSRTSFSDRDHSHVRSPTGSVHIPRRNRPSRKRSDISEQHADNNRADDDDNARNARDPPTTRKSGGYSHLVGFAYANNKRNHEFHRLFRSLPSYDYLLDDFSCAFSKDILIQGRMYVSEHNICFNSNILGWVTTLVIGFDEVVGLEKKMTAGLFPNAITVQTLHNRYSFASFISRDTVYEFLMSIWKQASQRTDGGDGPIDTDQSVSDLDDDDDNDSDFSGAESSGYDESEEESDLDSDNFSIASDVGFGDSVRPRAAANGKSEEKESKTSNKDSNRRESSGGNGGNEGEKSSSGGKGNGSKANGGGGESGGDDGNGDKKWPVSNLGPDSHGPTDPKFDIDAAKEKLLIKDTIHAPLGVVVNLLFGNDVTWITKFNEDNQKNFDLKHFGAFNNLEESGFRKYEYIKPINGSIGPKQTKCVCTDTIEKWDLENYVSVITATQTPDVPSGSSFTTLTRYTIWWTKDNETTLQLSYKMEWTGRSLIKGVIEKGTQDGQSTFAQALVQELNSSVSKSASTKAVTSSKSKSSSGKTKSSKKKKGSSKEKGDSLGDSKAKANASASSAGASSSDSGSILNIILDILLSPPIDIVPIPLGGLIIIALILFWLVRLMFGGGSSHSDIDAFTDAELAHLFMNSVGGGIGLGASGAAAAAAAALANNNDKGNWLTGEGSSTTTRNNKKKGKHVNSMLKEAYNQRLAQVRLEEEFILWSWIEDRTRFLGHDGVKYGLVNESEKVNEKRNTSKNGPPENDSSEAGDNHDLEGEQIVLADGTAQGAYYSQNLKEAVRLTEMRIAALKKRYKLD